VEAPSEGAAASAIGAAVSAAGVAVSSAFFSQLERTQSKAKAINEYVFFNFNLLKLLISYYL
jgi:hypothetical protein